jgi:hypothetical protein
MFAAVFCESHVCSEAASVGVRASFGCLCNPLLTSCDVSLRSNSPFEHDPRPGRLGVFIRLTPVADALITPRRRRSKTFEGV